MERCIDCKKEKGQKEITAVREGDTFVYICEKCQRKRHEEHIIRNFPHLKVLIKEKCNKPIYTERELNQILISIYDIFDMMYTLY